MNRTYCHYCGDDVEAQGAWLRDMVWSGAICYECYGTGGLFNRWLARVLRRFQFVLHWRKDLGGV